MSFCYFLQANDRTVYGRGDPVVPIGFVSKSLLLISLSPKRRCALIFHNFLPAHNIFYDVRGKADIQIKNSRISGGRKGDERQVKYFKALISVNLLFGGLFTSCRHLHFIFLSSVSSAFLACSSSLHFLLLFLREKISLSLHFGSIFSYFLINCCLLLEQKFCLERGML